MRLTRVSLLLLAVAALLGAAPAVPGADPAPLPYPDGLSMPVRLVGIDPADAARARAGLTAAEAAVAGAWLGGVQTVTAALSGKATPTINNRKWTDRMRAGRPTGTMPVPAVTVEPSWCSLMSAFKSTFAAGRALRATQISAAASSTSGAPGFFAA